MYPAPLAFYLAHEIAHIALGHLAEKQVLVDLEAPFAEFMQGDGEEDSADMYALEVLTGEPRPVVVPIAGPSSSRELGRVARVASKPLRIEPGTLALCFGYNTRDWATAYGAMPHIYTSAKPVWHEVNKVAKMHLALDRLPDDSADYLNAVLGSRQSS